MDPITVATRQFLRDLEKLFKRRPGRPARLVARMGDRSHVVKALRLAEYEPANRTPLFLQVAAFDAPEPYFAGLCQRALSDYELVRKGAAEEGVDLPVLVAPARPAALSPEAHAATVLAAIAERLATRLDGALVALVPKAIVDVAEWRRSIDRLSRATRPGCLRLAVLDPEDGPLSSLLGAEGARFAFDVDELFDFAQQQAQRKSEGPALPPGPALSPEQRLAHESATGFKIPEPDTTAALQALFFAGARATAKNDFRTAVDAYRRARDLCHDEDLRREEVAATFALGGAYLATGSRPMAQATYGQAALLAAEQKLWSISCQAKLGEAGVGFLEKDFGRAARAYAEAAALAERGELAPLRIEALRMEGICHQHRGAEPDAVQAWRKAIDVGTQADEPSRRSSSFREVVETLAALLDRRGLSPQASHLRTLLDSPGPSELPLRSDG